MNCRRCTYLGAYDAIWYAMYSCKQASNVSLPYTNGCIAV